MFCEALVGLFAVEKIRAICIVVAVVVETLKYMSFANESQTCLGLVDFLSREYRSYGINCIYVVLVRDWLLVSIKNSRPPETGWPVAYLVSFAISLV